jgi:hypothetical protein
MKQGLVLVLFIAMVLLLWKIKWVILGIALLFAVVAILTQTKGGK